MRIFAAASILAGAVIIGIALLSGRAHADGWVCPDKDTCISTTSYGVGLYRMYYKGHPEWVKIDCKNNTVSVLVDGETAPASEKIRPGSIAQNLFDKTCPMAFDLENW